MKSVFKRIQALFCSAVAGCLAAGCIFNANQPITPLTMQYIGTQGDTVSPLAVLHFAFSDSITSPLDFAFSPPVAQDYGISFNPANDTATLSFVEMLPGNTRYVVKLKTAVASTNGSAISPGNDSAVIWTGATEHEPNNSPALADTLKPPAIYGTLSDAQDTDVYNIPLKHAAFYFQTFTGQTSFSVKDSLLQDVSVAAGAGAGTADTFMVPGSTLFPIYVFVFSPIKGVTGVYRLGIVP